MGELRFVSVTEADALQVPWPDIYFTPHYGRAVEYSDNAEWELAMWTDGPILYPYLKRPIDTDLGVEGAFDIVSPYGYSGSWAPAEVPVSTWHAFRMALRAALHERGCVAEFQRLGNLVPGRKQLLAADTKLRGNFHIDTISLNVAQGYDTLWAAAEGRCRTATRKARKLGYTWSCRPFTPEDANPTSIFRKLYEQTMKRVEAAPYYLFPDAYYQSLQQHFSEQLYYLEVQSPVGAPVVAGMFMHWKTLLHSHLIASEPKATREGAGNLAYDGLIQWACQQQQITKMHIGGGIQSNDKLFLFKRSFGGDAEPFWTCRGIIDELRYAQLVHAAAETANVSSQVLEAIGYFPAYRGVAQLMAQAA